MATVKLDHYPYVSYYIDPSAGHVFQSMGPMLPGILGVIIGAIVTFFVKSKKKILGLFKKSKKDSASKQNSK